MTQNNPTAPITPNTDMPKILINMFDTNKIIFKKNSCFFSLNEFCENL